MVSDAGKTPENIRVSIGSAIVLKILNGKLDAAPTTAYLMTYRRGKCTANCGFCPQARESSGRADMLSRITWPAFPTKKVLSLVPKAVLDGAIKRVCIQALNYPGVFEDLAALIKAIKRSVSVPISVSCQPLNVENVSLLAEAGAERIGIPLDAATKEIFEVVKGKSVGGPYTWENQWKILGGAVEVLGKGMISTHFIVGLGETEKELVSAIQSCVDLGVLPALFAFTPIAGTRFQNRCQPSIQTYRRIQIARHLIVNAFSRFEKMTFNSEGEILNFGIDEKRLLQIVETGKPFFTSGCPNCNRPYYNEKPSGPIYNYPSSMTGEELTQILKECGLNVETYFA